MAGVLDRELADPSRCTPAGASARSTMSAACSARRST
jgi:hypothetical protein